MKSNKFGTHVNRRGGSSSALHGLVAKLHHSGSSVHGEANSTRRIFMDKEAARSFLEIRTQDSRLIELARKLQNR